MQNQEEKFIRLCVNGGTGFNIVIPANASWKISALEKHILEVYNDIANAEQSMERAATIRSIKRKGFYVSKHHRVGQCFDDWDEITCQIVLGSPEEAKDKKAEKEKRKEGRKESPSSEKPAPKVERTEKAAKVESTKSSISTDEIVKQLKLKQEGAKEAKKVLVESSKILEQIKKNLHEQGEAKKPREGESQANKKAGKNDKKIILIAEEQSSN